MEKRSDVSRDGRTGLKKPDKLDDKKQEIENIIVSEEYKELKILAVSGFAKRVWVRNMYPAKVGVVGPSGEKYIFAGRGSEVKVRRTDVETLLAKRRGGCCGTAPGRMFVLV